MTFSFPPTLPQGCGGQEEGSGEDRGAADEAGGAGYRSRGEQADCPRHLQAQLSGSSHLCGLVRYCLFLLLLFFNHTWVISVYSA